MMGGFAGFWRRKLVLTDVGRPNGWEAPETATHMRGCHFGWPAGSQEEEPPNQQIADQVEIQIKTIRIRIDEAAAVD
jgi:hypothetical protein